MIIPKITDKISAIQWFPKNPVSKRVVSTPTVYPPTRTKIFCPSESCPQ